MRTANSVSAPFLLVVSMLLLLLFQRVLFNLEYVRYSLETGIGIEDESDTEETDNYSLEHQTAGVTGNYIIYGGERYKPEYFFILVFVMQGFVFIIPAVFYIKLFKSEGYIKDLNLKLPELKRAPLALYALGALVSGTAFLSSLLYYMFGASLELRAAVIDAGSNPVYDISAVMAFVLLPAICEEFFFRSVMLREYDRYGAACACIITSAAFAALHFSLALFPIYFFAGSILYIITKASGSIIFAVIAHAGHRFFNIYIWNRLSNVLSFEQNRFIFSFMASAIFIIFMIALLNKTEKIYYYKAYVNDPAPESITGRLPLRNAFSPTLLAVAIIYFIGINT